VGKCVKIEQSADILKKRRSILRFCCRRQCGRSEKLPA